MFYHSLFILLFFTIAALSVGANQKMQNKNKKNKNEDKLESVEETNKSGENSDINSRAESPNPEQPINRKSKHSDALGRMVKSSHYRFIFKT